MASYWLPIALVILCFSGVIPAAQVRNKHKYSQGHMMPRPLMFPKGRAEDIERPSRFEFSGTMETHTLYQLASQVARAKQAEIKQIIETLERGDMLGVMAEPLKEMSKALIDEETPECTGCKAIANRLKMQVDNGVPFEAIGDPLIVFCETLAPFIDVNPVICNGSVNMQGIHIYEVLNRGTAQDFCEALNTCIPPRLCSYGEVESRLPWKRSPRRPAPGSRRQKRARRVYDRAEVMAVAQLTDIHFQPKYAIGSATDCGLPACCRDDYPGTGSARAWGEYSCNIPERTVHLFLDKVAELNPDFILYSGDTPPHTLWDETLTSQLNCSNILVNALKQKLPGFTVYPAIGNHELFPTNIYHPDVQDTADFNEVFTDMWSPLAGFGPDQEATMKHLGYYSTEYAPGLRILSMNTILDWYNGNFYAAINGDADFNREYKIFVETTLRDARTNNEKVIVIGHNPTGGGSTIVRASRWFEELAVEYGDVIVLHIAGHTHSDHFRLFMDPVTGEARHVIHVCPSANTRTNNNPSMRVYFLDRTTFQLLNYENHYMDLDMTAGADDIPEIVYNYQATQLYDLPDMSPASWQDLTLRFIEDDELFQSWYLNYRVHTSNGYCDKNCKENYLCSIWFPNYDEEQVCKDTLDIASTSPAATTTTDSGQSTAARGAAVSLSTLMVALLVVLF